mmetsp:Transcript_9610/g.17248  ORF Transcript_9610/g.17248 Transcript_9610/m.17248 type:complete len:207 (+) Transcript_9610:91-711(+)|eukprot:CAMPEP_0197625300 /NCGR_PEP_ID=MMETSP1338-20131121/4696_1 /TAXON_ID=43686 ORGANISM="Pelagodinium beii, Strain RCC1491" /NCGR_SAMPLE_ID=MMETSP1338 /ASSEMBLY_ACC=CAM_ASM_000754 /LENGTH=206 /DNA_ID=CAMNT_0043195663 /DNA_START=86 /DNA_END=706 /DNA_ORIENTATION=+
MGGRNHDSSPEFCFCFDQKKGVLLVAAGTLAYAFIYMVSLLDGDVRFQSGGYAPFVAKLQALYGSLGLLAGFLGIQGALDSKAHSLAFFSSYLTWKLVVLLIVFISDARLLLHCEDWKDSSNFAMYSLSSEGLCPTARQSYLLGFFLDFGFQVYFTFSCRGYANWVVSNPSYAITFDSDARYNQAPVKFYDPTIGEPGRYITAATV